MSDETPTIAQALLSVYDKSGIVDFARKLEQHGVRILSTGGTAQFLRENGIDVTLVQDVTGFPEMLDGRVKTLHPAVHAGILARRDRDDHGRQLEEHGIPSIDLVAINLYPFEKTAESGARFDDCIEQIDIGGPAMLRSAAKNHAAVTVVSDPSDYDAVIREITSTGGTSPKLRLALAAKAFSLTARYDIAIGNYLSQAESGSETLPARLLISYPLELSLRYGENPHQPAALYGSFLRSFEKLHGKELSYNNIADIDAATALIDEFDSPAAAIIKHTNPCGCATADSVLDAYKLALSTDQVSSFGGIVVVNREIDIRLAQLLNEMFFEVIIAPGFADDAYGILQRKRDRRLIRRSGGQPSRKGRITSVKNAYLYQFDDSEPFDESSWRVVTHRTPNDGEMQALRFAWRVVRHVKSNAIVYADAKQTLGIGAGQMSRVDAASIAVMKAANAGLALQNSVMASDAFFPFADGMLEAVRAGSRAIIQPGGSVRDEEVIAAADEHDIAMIFTGTRHFKH